MITIPKSIKIGGNRYKVSIVSPTEVAEKTGAYIDTTTLNVKIVKGKPEYMQQAFLHEIIHGINMELEETTVEFLAQALHQIIVDNPKLFSGGDSHGST